MGEGQDNKEVKEKEELLDIFGSYILKPTEAVGKPRVLSFKFV